MTERPGIMLYFDMAEPFKGLSYEEKGRLLEAMLDYGQFSVVPEFDGLLAFAWGFTRPKLDQDARSYRKKVVKNTYSSYCAKEKKGGNTPLDFEEWCAQECIDTTEWSRSVPVDTERYPNTTPKTDTSPTAIPKANTIVDTDGGGKGEEVSFEDLKRQRLAMLLEHQPNGRVNHG